MPPDGREPLGPEDVVVLPAFGVTTAEMQRFGAIGCVMVDTTCGSVLNVWKNVKRYAQDGFTSVIHGKVWHEETQATASQALDYDRRPLSRRAEPRRDQRGVRLHPPRRRPRPVSRAVPRCRLARASIPTAISQHIGLANQTTMLMSESLRGAGALSPGHASIGTATTRSAVTFRAFDTICSATQDRQDAVVALLKEQPVDLMIVIGGYNSSNTCNLARICAEQVPDVPHRRSRLPGVGRCHPLPAGWAARTRSRPGLAARPGEISRLG